MEELTFQTAVDGKSTKVGCGCLLTLIAIVYALFQPSFGSASVSIHDEASILEATERKELATALQKLGQGFNVHFSIVTVINVDPGRLSFEADRAASKIDEDQSWLWRHVVPR